MIIKSLRASNFMKFSRIDVDDLPARGEIAVIGENEAGKTTLGECIAFALFGRTVRTEESDPAQVINWNADECETAITVSVAGKGYFRIERGVSRGGTLTARLISPDGTVLADDVAAVTRMLPRVLGFNFPEFRYSFYVAQKEIDIIRHARKDNTRQIVYDMLGITAVERAQSVIEKEITEYAQKGETLDRDLAVSRALRLNVDIDEDTMRRYEQQKLEIDDKIGVAVANEQSAREGLDRARALGAARTTVLGAFDRFQRAYLAENLKSRLETALPTIQAIGRVAGEVGEAANQEILGDEKNYNHTVDKLQRLRSSIGLVKELDALVKSRGAALAAELQTGDPSAADFTPKSRADFLAVEQQRSSTLGSQVGKATLGLLLNLLLFLAAAGVAGAIAAGKLPIEAGALPAELKPIQLAGGLGVLGAVFFVLTILSLLRRSGLSAQRSLADRSRASLEAELTALREEKSACDSFTTARLSDIESGVARIPNEAVKRKFQELSQQARDLLQSPSSPDQMLHDEADKEKKLREARDARAPRMSLAYRMRRMAKQGEDRIRAVLGADASTSAPVRAAAQEALQSKDIEKLEPILEDMLGDATQAAISWESMTAGESFTSVAECARTMHGGLQDAFRVHNNGAAVKARYDAESKLPGLLDESATERPAEDLQADLKAEAGLLRELLGAEEQVEDTIAAARQTLQAAQEQRMQAESERVSLFARSDSMREQRARYDDLSVKIAGLENAMAPLNRDVAIRKELMKLYGETIDGMKSRFGPNLARYIELLLPRITRNRYRKVQITSELDIRVYSSDRRDFVRLIDLSFGTSDQILLALRLGLAQALVHSRGIRSGEQFMFLDEPLEAFDESRSQAFLQLLRTFDDNFSQIFVSSTRGLNMDFDKTITLTADRNELLVASA